MSSQMRSNYCGLVTEAQMGQTVSLCGWVNRRRDHGGVIFVDLRDREGYVQVVCDPDRADMFKTAEGVRNEFCIQVKGMVRARPEGTVNDGLKSGKIEVLCHEMCTQPQRDTAVPVGRRQPVRDHPPNAPCAGSAPPVHAKQPDAALPRGHGNPQVFGRQWFH